MRRGHASCPALQYYPQAFWRLFMSGSYILWWIVVGLIAGVLASLVVGGIGYGILGDIVVGIVGAFIGGWLFSALGITTPFGGMGGTIFVAFIGAVVLLFILRLIRGSTRKI